MLQEKLTDCVRRNCPQVPFCLRPVIYTSVLAKSEAIASGFDEAILMNSQGKVAETSAMNLFVARDGRLITPGVDQDILGGITRASVVAIARALDILVIERPLDKSELFIADEVFLCGTAAQITPVLSVENHELSDERSVTTKLKTLLRAIAQGHEPRYQSWLTEIQLTEVNR